MFLLFCVSGFYKFIHLTKEMDSALGGERRGSLEGRPTRSREAGRAGVRRGCCTRQDAGLRPGQQASSARGTPGKWLYIVYK